MSVDFYYSDLRPEAQERFLKAQGITDPKEGNFDMDIGALCAVEEMNTEDC